MRNRQRQDHQKGADGPEDDAGEVLIKNGLVGRTQWGEVFTKNGLVGGICLGEVLIGIRLVGGDHAKDVNIENEKA